MEVAALGKTVFSIAERVTYLKNCVVLIDKATWDQTRSTLKMHVDKQVVGVSGLKDEYADVDFHFIAFEDVPSQPNWSRLSLRGYVHEVAEDSEPRSDGRKVWNF